MKKSILLIIIASLLPYLILAQDINDAWGYSEGIAKGKFKPPKEEAYREYLKIFTTQGGWWNREHARKAFEMDPTFYLAALEELFWLADGQNEKYDSLAKVLAPSYDQMTPFEKSLFNSSKALYDRDYTSYVKYREEQMNMFPTDISANSHYTFHLMVRENKPMKAWKTANMIDWATMPEEFHAFRQGRIQFLCWFGIGAEAYDEAVKLADTYLQDAATPWQKGLYVIYKSTALVRSGQMEKINKMVEELKQTEKLSHWWAPEFDVVNFCNEMAIELFLMDKPAEARRLLNLALEWTSGQPGQMSTLYDSLDLAQTHRLLGQHDKALSLSQHFVDAYDRSTWANDEYVSLVGVDYAALGEKDKAKSVIKLLEEQGNDNALYYIARIYAALGEREKAMVPLVEWRKGWGWSYNSMKFFKYDYFMKNMFGYAPFEEHVRLRD